MYFLEQSWPFQSANRNQLKDLGSPDLLGLEVSDPAHRGAGGSRNGQCRGVPGDADGTHPDRTSRSVDGECVASLFRAHTGVHVHASILQCVSTLETYYVYMYLCI